MARLLICFTENLTYVVNTVFVFPFKTDFVKITATVYSGAYNHSATYRFSPRTFHVVSKIQIRCYDR